MENIEKFRSWSHYRQSLNKRSDNALHVLEELCGVYSWHPSTALSLRARLGHFTAEDFRALNNSSSILRIPCMRLSVHMVPSEYAARLMAATVPSDPAHWEKRYSQAGRKIPSASYESIKKAILKASEDALEPKAIAEKAGVDEGIIKFVLNRMAFEGYIIRIGSDNLRSNILRYQSAKSAFGKFLAGDDQKTSLRWLAQKYLSTFGPARIKDFQWWAGINVSRAREAVQELDTEILVLGKEEYHLSATLSSDYKKFNQGSDGQIDILPQWDAYTMGYAPDGRQRFVEPQYQNQIYGAIGATGGNGLGTILSEGQAIASWDQKLSGTKLQLNVHPFKKLPSATSARLEAEFQEIGNLYGVTKLEIKYS